MGKGGGVSVMETTRIHVYGRVQGVGFRPFVYGLASKLALKGSVENNPEGVSIELYGEQKQIEQFLMLLQNSAPPMSYIESISCQTIQATSIPENFSIKASRTGSMRTSIPLDTAICSACVAEMEDKTNRRWAYPFTHCSHCGPRFSIIHSMPFDRDNTSMAAFTMCDECQVEYENPESRRFHNQANCCEKCGPRIWLEDTNGLVERAGDAVHVLEKAADIIRSGGILALKGIGGFNFVCDATNYAVINRLRQRKKRPAKSLALMAANITMVEQYAAVSPFEKELLTSAQAPIVLLDKKTNSLPVNIAPDLNRLGFVLPYTALHILLLKNLHVPLVFTSGNTSGAPQCTNNSKARDSLAGIADFFLMHDREIVQGVEDSVLQVVGNQEQTMRAGRGLIPLDLKFPDGFSSEENILAMGAQVKNTICLADKNKITLSAPLNTLSNTASLDAYQERNAHLLNLCVFTPTRVIVDKHKEYNATIYGEDLAEQLDVSLQHVQHHHAHLAACLLEYGCPHQAPPILGICLDGTGMGEDGEIWGAEFFVFNYQTCKRIASFDSIPLLGGSVAIKEPWRSAYGHLRVMGDWQNISKRYANLELFDFFNSKSVQILEQMIVNKINAPFASSAGRLFDAVAAVLNICRDEISYEGQAAMELQAHAEQAISKELPSAYPFEVKADISILRICWKKMWQELMSDLEQGIDSAYIALRFHATVVAAILSIVDTYSKKNNTSKVALSGGVFQNSLLVSLLQPALLERGISVYLPRTIPCNDSCLSLGQATITAALKGRSERGKDET